MQPASIVSRSYLLATLTESMEKIIDLVEPSVRDFLKTAGRMGGVKTLAKHGKKHYRKAAEKRWELAKKKDQLLVATKQITK